MKITVAEFFAYMDKYLKIAIFEPVYIVKNNRVQWKLNSPYQYLDRKEQQKIILPKCKVTLEVYDKKKEDQERKLAKAKKVNRTRR